MPATTWASSDWMSCSLRTNDTVTGVSAGVLPNTVAPGSVAGLTPEGTWGGVVGSWLGEATAPGATARAATTAPAPMSIPAVSRACVLRFIYLCTVLSSSAHDELLGSRTPFASADLLHAATIPTRDHVRSGHIVHQIVRFSASCGTMGELHGQRS